MKNQEFFHLLAALLILTLVIWAPDAFNGSFSSLPKASLFAIIILILNIGVKKITAYLLDADVEHEIWKFERFGFEPSWYFKKGILAGLIVPLFFSIISLGALKIPTLLTYETRALKRRAAKRFGFYSYTEMTDLHNSIIGASGIIALLILTIVAYFLPYNLEYLAKMATFYAFWNLLPISKLDGTQIFFGSRILYSVLAAITIIFTFYALVL